VALCAIGLDCKASETGELDVSEFPVDAPAIDLMRAFSARAVDHKVRVFFPGNNRRPLSVRVGDFGCGASLKLDLVTLWMLGY